MALKGKKKSKPITAEALVEQGNIARARCEPELALNFYKRAHETKPEDTAIMDALADVRLQLGEQDVGLELLIKSTTIAPDTNPHKWLYLAQLQEGAAALHSYEKAVSLLKPLTASEVSEQ